MPSSSKENARSTTSESRSPTKMNNGDVFSSPGSEMMLSPPPEEELRFSTRRPTHEPSSATRPLANSMRTNQQQSPVANQAAKRKRTITGSGASAVHNQSSTEHTPNPRVRKQVRQAAASTVQSRNAGTLLDSPSGGQSSIMQPPMTPTRKGKARGRSTELVSQSPHAANPNADYIPAARLAYSPRGVSVRRRSVTPIPPYEPPKERYTPPREVIVSPPAPERKPVRRTTTKKKRVTVKMERAPVQLWVKTEPPEIDLTSPAPPASPGDDPILLVGPPSIRVQRPSLPPDDSREVSFVDLEMDLELPENRSRAKPDTTQQAKSTEVPARSPSIPPAFDFSKLNDDDSGMAAKDIPDSSSEVDYGTLIDDSNYGTFDDGNYATLDDGAWSDSDNENGNGEETTVGEGDFTGKFLSFQAPVKLDPPADDGDDRMEKWARPISPHPKKFSLVDPKEEDVDVSLDEVAEKTTDQSTNAPGAKDRSAADGDDTQDEIQEVARPALETRRGRRLTLSEVEAIKFGTNKSTAKSGSVATANVDHSQEGRVEEASPEQTDGVAEQRNSAPSRLVKPVPRRKHERSATLDKTNILDNHSEHRLNLEDGLNNQEILHAGEGNDVFSTRSTPGHSSEESSQSTLNNPDVTGHEPNDDHVAFEEHKKHLLRYGKDAIRDETMDQAASLLREADRADGRAPECETEIAAEDDLGETSDEGASDMSVVKIVSDDPMAAARAAAILKAHDYDMVARKLRRRKTTGGGISKAYNTPKNAQLWRRRTVAGLTAEDVLSANVSLPDLLQKAEEELRCSPTRSRSGSVACSSIGSPQKPRWSAFMYEDADAPGIREWCKADWKLLDSCFTDERYDLAEQMGLEPGCLADVDDVPLESVVERFVELMGGAEIIRSHGPSWATDKLFSRVKALCKRQRAGHGAPPTPDVSARFSTPSRFSMSPTPSMVVPDFTPAVSDRTWMYDSGSVSRKALLPPPSSDSFFKVPSLPARHSRLREDVTSDVVDTPKPSRALDLFGFATPARNVPQPQPDDSDDESVAQEVDAMLTPITASRIRQSRPESAVKRSLSYISSWLKPDMYKSNKEERKGSQLPGLPVPPEDLLSKPRGPVETPAPKPAEKPVPHKELVSLEHVPPPKPTRIPRPQKPQRLVDLNHVPTPEPKEEVKKRSLSRRSSTSSVKDLIKEFEDKDKGKVQALPPRVAELRRQASVGSLKGNGKPTWKP